MKNAALFPVSAETLPLARYINKNSSEYKITTLLAFPGSGLCGKDAGYADNRGITGMVVSDNILETKEMWDVILIVELSDPDGEAHIRKLTVEAIKSVLELDKRVVCSARLLPDELNLIREISGSRNVSFIYLPEDKINITKRIFGSISQPSSYVIFVGGIIQEANSFEVFLSLLGKLQVEYDVLPISTNINCNICGVNSLYQILYSKDDSVTEKIYAINDYIKILSEKKHPDIIIVHISEAMMEYNDKITNGFGLLPYMISKALIPDFFICGIPYGFGHSITINNLSNGINNKIGYPINYVHLSNTEIDPSDMLESNISVSFTSYETVEKQINQFCIDSDIYIRNALEDEGIDDLYMSLAKEFEEHYRVISIIK